jgi:ABC-type transport system substrate-binding protein
VQTGSLRGSKLSAVIVVVVLGLLAASCGGSSGNADGNGPASITDVTIAASGSPKSGGQVVYGLEAETDGFNPTANRWSASGYMVGSAVFDPLTAFDDKGNWQPYLAKSFTPSADFRTWTITMRSGVTFSNGQPLDGAAVAQNLNATRKDALTGAALRNLSDVAVDPSDPMKVIATATDPWATFPTILSGQIGYMAAPAQLEAAKPASSNQPIGTGPFVQREWIPDNRWVGTRNPNYWRTDASGTQLPYLDSVEFRPVVDPQTRLSALLSGELTMMVNSDWPITNRMRSEAESGNMQMVLDRSESEEGFVLLNTESAPLNDVRVRRALALCTDLTPVLAASETPSEMAADSQFAPDSPFYVDTKFPRNDVAAGTALIDSVKAETGGNVTVSLTTNPVPTLLAVASLLAAQWSQCGVTVEQQSIEQSKMISDAVTGKLQAVLWRQFGGDDPDGNYVWWTGKNARGLLALNTARLQDPQIDAALDRARATDDLGVRKEAYAELQRRQTELVPYIWLSHTQWVLGAANTVRNIGNKSLPEGQTARPFGGAVFRLTEVWLDK